MIAGLLVILLIVLILPFTLKTVEENLEVFLFAMGMAASAIGGALNKELFVKAVQDPVHITAAVFAAALLFKWFRRPLEHIIMGISVRMPIRLFLAAVVIGLGLLSSIITAIIASIILVMIVGMLQLDRKSEIRVVILACFSIGLGAALTPVGEPLSTIAISKLNADFFYLMREIGPETAAALMGYGLLTAILIRPGRHPGGAKGPRTAESYPEIFLRAIKIYLFVMGLTLLGAGFEPLISRYLLGLSPHILYWVNMISAVLDNATLAAAEISPSMPPETVKSILLGLLISGGMLIPGNIPNIIAAGKLNISSREWASFGVPVGLAAMCLFFVILLLFS